MSDPFIGEIRIFGGNFAPTGWALCQGQILPIAQNTALFSILGTTYGGNGQTTFALPDLRGRAPIQQGQGPGLSPYSLGQVGGSETVTLLNNQMPAHTHLANCNTNAGDGEAPAGAIWADSQDANRNPINSYSSGGPNGTMSPQAIGAAGGSQPHNNLQPYLAINFIIALQGIYPSRS